MYMYYVVYTKCYNIYFRLHFAYYNEKGKKKCSFCISSHTKYCILFKTKFFNFIQTKNITSIFDMIKSLCCVSKFIHYKYVIIFTESSLCY